MTSIGDKAFYSCSSLTSITIPESVTSIGNDAFSCTGLTALIIPKSVTSIGNYAFSSCRSLNTITIPDSVTNIGNYAFSDCTSLTTITIPDSVTSLVGAFYDCTSLTTITIPGSMTSISPDIFHGCTSLLSISIPESVTSIGNNAFAECSSLTMITIPEGVTSIEAAAFYKCIGLLNITIPKNVSSIGSYAFNGCTNLTSITIKPEVPPTGEMRMFDDTNNAPIYVPVGSVELYKSATCWSDYADRIYAIGTPMAVDLGLSVKWASFNLGATTPEEYGDYYAWGETEPYYNSQGPLIWKEGKENGYSLSSYKWCMDNSFTMTKYCTNSSYGYNGFMDSKTVLDPEDDAAHVNWGGKWRMPTDAEWTELREKCTWMWTTLNGVNGREVTGPNGKTIFFPAAGYWLGTYHYYAGSDGYYWCSSLDSDIPYDAWGINFYYGDVYRIGYSRHGGCSVRPILE